MTFTLINYFLEVAKCLNFSTASKRLYVSQPTLSKQISVLEDEMGCKLFKRTTKKVELTEAGAYLYQELSPLWEELDTIIQTTQSIAKIEKNVLRVGLFDGPLISDFWPAMYTNFYNLFPEKRLELVRANFQDLEDGFYGGEYDIIFTLDFAIPDRFKYHTRQLIYRKYAFIYSENSEFAKKSDLSFADFQGKDWFVVDADCCVNRVLQEFNALGITNPKIHRVKDQLTVMTNIESGRGFAVLDKNLVVHNKNLRCFSADEYFSGTYVIGVWKTESSIINKWLSEFV